MSVYKSPKSPFYQYDFQISGNRFHGTTKTRSKREAEAIVRELKKNAREDSLRRKKTGREPLTFDVAVGRYWAEVGQHRVSHVSYHSILSNLVDYFGPDRLLEAIDNEAMVRCIAHYRQKIRWGKTKLKSGPPRTISNATVNRITVEPLKAIFRRAKLWGYHLPNEPQWRAHTLREPQERVRELTKSEQEALEASLRQDYQLWFDFAQQTGRRISETLIRWDEVNWEAQQISSVGKGGRKVWTPITPSIAAILNECLGHHPEFVFTYIAQRTRDKRVKGQRYPITIGGAVSIWKRAVRKANVKDFRFHDNRHDTATKLLRREGNLKLVQRVLNHTQITTTAKYAHVMDDEVAEALERNAQSRKISRTS